jgi:hypothetical protein
LFYLSIRVNFIISNDWTKVIHIFELPKHFFNIFIKMDYKHAWMKYINTLGIDNELTETYRNIRLAFQREGWSDEDIKSPPYYPDDILRNFQKFSTLKDNVYSELRSFFGDVDNNEFNAYLMDKLQIIDLETPLKNGNKKRNNRRD